MQFIFCVYYLDIPDRELNCAGYWLEDMRSYMITYDLEDAVSAFRCWVRNLFDSTSTLTILTSKSNNDYHFCNK